jgi:hypothetical protein
MTYLEWNDRLAAHFFRPEMAGRSVFLYVTQELLDELGAPANDTWRGFVSAVKTGHQWCRSSLHALCQKAQHCQETWRLHTFDYPPYIAYLGLFVLAAGKEGDFAPHAYYPRLWELLGETGEGMLPDFNKMHLLWEDLERWANEDKLGDLGLFAARIAGGWVHVGMPIAQTVLTEDERGALPAVFAASGLDPTAFPPDPELTRLLLAHGAHSLRRRTLGLLQRDAGDGELKAVLLGIVKEELSRWDGQTGAVAPGGHERVCGNLRLCAAIDRVASAARFGLRCSLNRDFPEEGLLLTGEASGVFFTCQEEILHWSTEISDAEGHGPIDPAQWRWEGGLSFRETQFGWRFTLRASPVRIFVDGATEGLSGNVEVNQLPATGPFYLALSLSARPAVEAWGSSACTGFRPVAIRRGLPAGWGLFWAGGLTNGAAPCVNHPELSPPSARRLLLRGGIRARRRNWYLPFGLPEVVLEAPRGGETVTCAGSELRGEGGVYRLPPDLPKDRQLVAEACGGAQVTRSHPFVVIGEFTWQWDTAQLILDRFGAPKDPSLPQEGVAGAAAAGVLHSRVLYCPHPSCFQGERVFFIGCEPGQIVAWPTEPLPGSWQPVWAVPLGRKGRVIFCGTDAAASEPRPTQHHPACKKFRLWKDILYHRRKLIRGPSSPRLAQLWRKYQEAARRA